MIKRFLFIFGLTYLLNSCAYTGKTMEYSSELKGNQFTHIVKDRDLTKTENRFQSSFAYKDISHFSETDYSKIKELSLSYTLQRKAVFHSFNLFYMSGNLRINTQINETDLNESFNFGHLGFRYEYSKAFKQNDFIFRIFQIQAAAIFDYGDYFDWRQKIEADQLQNVRIKGEKSMQVSFTGNPEIEYLFTDHFSSSFFSGITVIIDQIPYQSGYSYLYGMSLKYRAFEMHLYQSFTAYQYHENNKFTTLDRKLTELAFTILY